MDEQEIKLKQKRQQYHKLLLSLGEEKYKDVIVEATFSGCESTTQLNESQIDRLITEAQARLGKRGVPAQRKPLSPTLNPEEHQIRQLRNKCLQVMGERGFKSTPKDWSAINNELSAPRYQWVLSEEQRQSGLINKRGIGTFNTVKSLRKLFYQLCAIRDNEKNIKTKVVEKAIQN